MALPEPPKHDEIQAPLQSWLTAWDFRGWFDVPVVWGGRTASAGPTSLYDGYPQVPPELTTCFDSGERDLSRYFVPRISFVEPPEKPVLPGDHRRVRRIDGHTLRGFLVVEVMREPELTTWSLLRVPRPRYPKLDFGEAVVTHLVKGLHRTLPAFQWCYERALADSPELAGRVTLRLSATGATVVDAAPEVRSPELNCCLENAHRLWGVRAHGDGELRIGLALGPIGRGR
jgi:hypothetical protein